MSEFTQRHWWGAPYRKASFGRLTVEQIKTYSVKDGWGYGGGMGAGNHVSSRHTRWYGASFISWANGVKKGWEDSGGVECGYGNGCDMGGGMGLPQDLMYEVESGRGGPDVVHNNRGYC